MVKQVKIKKLEERIDPSALRAYSRDDVGADTESREPRQDSSAKYGPVPLESYESNEGHVWHAIWCD